MDKPSTSEQPSTIQNPFPVNLSREIKREIESSTQAIQPTLQFPTTDQLNPMTEQMQNFLRSAQQQMPTAYSNSMLFGSG